VAVFDQDLAPFAGVLIEAVQGFDREAVAALGVLGTDVLGAHSPADSPSVADLLDGKLCQRRGVDHIVQAAVDQPDVRLPASGDDLGDQLLAAAWFRWCNHRNNLPCCGRPRGRPC
jgi:hypothetical protein